MASSNAPTSTTDPLQEGLPKSKPRPAALADKDNMPTNTTEPSLHPKEYIPDPIDENLESAGGNSGKTSRQGSSPIQNRPTNEVKSIEVAILLQTIQSQQELQKTFEK
jgi:hypothetical protein